MNEEQLNILIERYFEGDTTAKEEADLRRALALCKFDTPQVREVKAVIGYAAIAARGHRPRSHAFVAKVASLVASVALIAGIAIYMWPSPVIYGYAYGQEIRDEGQALMFMNADFEAFSIASADVETGIAADLSLFSSVFSENN